MEENIEFNYCDDVITNIARNNFGIKYLYPWQRLVIANILEAYNYQKYYNADDDSFCKGRQIILLPTGAGKSLCFQIPSLILDGPSLIIYPLLALMTDQQRRMEECSISCVLLRGGQGRDERKNCFSKIQKGAKVIIANPEILKNKDIIAVLKKAGIKHIVIDEAHCISEWGDSFRPAYLELGNVIKEINPPLVSAFTATGSDSVVKRISEILFDGKAHVVRSESDRQNIQYFVRSAVAKEKEVLNLINTQPRPIIVFCGTRNNAENMAREINVFYGKCISKFYHGGLKKTEKDNIEKWFYNSRDGVLCATCAYGMGIDKKDIKTVIHIQIPDTPEAYIQEAGRAGRDGSIVNAILLYSLEDAFNIKNSFMKEFIETKECRRQVLLKALGDNETFCNGCDLCNKRREINRISNIYDKNIFLRKKYIKRFEKAQYMPDWEEVFFIIKKRKFYYSETELADEIFYKMNKKYNKSLGVNIWTHKDSMEIIRQLKSAGKLDIKPDKSLWKGKISAISSKRH